MSRVISLVLTPIRDHISYASNAISVFLMLMLFSSYPNHLKANDTNTNEACQAGSMAHDCGEIVKGMCRKIVLRLEAVMVRQAHHVWFGGLTMSTSSPCTP